MSTHDYETKMLLPLELDETSVLVGECGGLSAVFEAGPSHASPGFWRVETEHGSLYLDPDVLVEVLAQVGAK